MDLLDNSAFESLLRLASSGQVGYGAASPSCNDYSRIKLKADSGPRAIRTPEHLNGIPNLTHSEQLRIQSSHQMLYRCLVCLSLIFQAGGHCHLEQPANAMSWLEPMTRQFLLAISAACICIPACKFHWNIYKTWMFASSFHALQVLGGKCTHPPHSHESIQGVRDQWGNFVSRATACYPPDLATSFAETISPLLTSGQKDLVWTDIHQLLPIKQVDDFPVSQVDGGGLLSQPNWSRSDRTTPDTFSFLRKAWLQRIISLRMDKMLIAHIQSGSPDPPFSREQLIPFVQDLEIFLRQHDIQPDWSVREHQPMHLQILAAMHRIMQVPDTKLFPSLIEGVRTGFGPAIPASGVFPTKSQETLPSTPLSVHLSNWQSAEQNLPLTRELVVEEVSKGFVFKYPGTLEQAQQEYPLGVSMGKLGIATSDSRPPQLVVDSSICGLNGRCVIPEKSTLPTAKELIRSFPLRGSSQMLSGFSLDIKSAHKRIVLHPEERGLVGFSLDGDLYFYLVTPFGATFSASWWS